MPSKAIDHQNDTGILSRRTAAVMIGCHRNYIELLASVGSIQKITIPGQKSWRISALELMIHLIKCRQIFPVSLAKAALNFAYKFEPHHLSYAKKILTEFSSLSPDQRANLQVSVDKEEEVVWDTNGNLSTGNKPQN